MKVTKNKRKERNREEKREKREGRSKKGRAKNKDPNKTEYKISDFKLQNSEFW